MPLTPAEQAELDALRGYDGSSSTGSGGLTAAERDELAALKAYSPSGAGGALDPADEPGVLSSLASGAGDLAYRGAEFFGKPLFDLYDVLDQGFGPGFRLPDSVGERRDRTSETGRDIAAFASPAAGGTILANLAGQAGKGYLKRSIAAAAGSGIGDATGQAVEDLAQGAVPEFDDEQIILSTLLGGGGQLAGEGIGALLSPKGKLPVRLTEGGQAADDIGFTLTRGEATGDLATRKAEEVARQTGGDFTSGPLRELDAARPAEIDEVARGLVGTSPTETVARAGSRGIDQLGLARAEQSEAVRQAYVRASEFDGTVAPEAFEHLTIGLNNIVEHQTGFNSRLRNQVGEIMENMQEAIADTPGVRGGVSLRSVDQLRQSLNTTINSLSGPSNEQAQRIAIMAKEHFDGWVDDVVDSMLFSGDDAALVALKDARQLNEQFKSRFGQRPGDRAGRIIDDLLNEQVDDAVNKLFGIGKLGIQGTGEAVRRIELASPEAFESFRQAAWLKMIQNRQGEVKGAGQLANEIRRNLNEAPDVMRSLFQPGELRNFEKLASALESTQVPAKAINPPRSGWTILEGITKQLLPVGAGFSLFSGSLAPLALAIPSLNAGLKNFMTTRRALEYVGKAPETEKAIRAAIDAAAGPTGRVGATALVDRDRPEPAPGESILDLLPSPVSSARAGELEAMLAPEPGSPEDPSLQPDYSFLEVGESGGGAGQANQVLEQLLGGGGQAGGFDAMLEQLLGGGGGVPAGAPAPNVRRSRDVRTVQGRRLGSGPRAAGSRPSSDDERERRLRRELLGIGG